MPTVVRSITLTPLRGPSLRGACARWLVSVMAWFSLLVFLFMLFHQYFGLVAQNDLAALVDDFDTHRQHSPSGVPRGALVLDLHFRVQRVARPHRHLEDERIHAQPGQHVDRKSTRMNSRH